MAHWTCRPDNVRTARIATGLEASKRDLTSLCYVKWQNWQCGTTWQAIHAVMVVTYQCDVPSTPAQASSRYALPATRTVHHTVFCDARTKKQHCNNVYEYGAVPTQALAHCTQLLRSIRSHKLNLGRSATATCQISVSCVQGRHGDRTCQQLEARRASALDSVTFTSCMQEHI